MAAKLRSLVGLDPKSTDTFHGKRFGIQRCPVRHHAAVHKRRADRLGGSGRDRDI